ncbi:MAG: cyclic pyranopterin monophosphate synthase MoaC [Bacteroidota bacterium]
MDSENKQFSHLDPTGNPQMVDVSQKAITKRVATARALMALPPEVAEKFQEGEIQTAKGPVFQTAILAGTMAVKQTSNLIPLCHPLAIEKIHVDISLTSSNEVSIFCTVTTTGKTGVEMEALTGASMAALTIYDMCKALSHHMTIKEVRLWKKSGGKSDFEAEKKS